MRVTFYVSVINEVIDYVEHCIGDSLQLSELSSRAGISDFHFNRMFKTVTGTTLKQYILGRKLTNAMELLKDTKRTILDISLELGFEYPEVFSRAFKKQFGVSPALYRQNKPSLPGIPKACIVERDIINYRGSLALKGSSILLEPLTLAGNYVDINTNSDDFKQLLQANTEAFLRTTCECTDLHMDKFYTMVRCSGKEDKMWHIFHMQASIVPEAKIALNELCSLMKAMV